MILAEESWLKSGVRMMHRWLGAFKEPKKKLASFLKIWRFFDFKNVPDFTTVYYISYKTTRQILIQLVA